MTRIATIAGLLFVLSTPSPSLADENALTRCFAQNDCTMDRLNRCIGRCGADDGACECQCVQDITRCFNRCTASKEPIKQCKKAEGTKKPGDKPRAP